MYDHCCANVPQNSSCSRTGEVASYQSAVAVETDAELREGLRASATERLCHERVVELGGIDRIARSIGKSGVTKRPTARERLDHVSERNVAEQLEGREDARLKNINNADYTVARSSEMVPNR